MTTFLSGVGVCALIVIAFIGIGMFSSKTRSPRNSKAAFERGVNCGNRLLAGCCDSDVRQQYGIPKERAVTQEDRAKYGVSKLEESSDFGHRDEFDAGYSSVVRPFYDRVVTDA